MPRITRICSVPGTIRNRNEQVICKQPLGPLLDASRAAVPFSIRLVVRRHWIAHGNQSALSALSAASAFRQLSFWFSAVLIFRRSGFPPVLVLSFWCLSFWCLSFWCVSSPVSAASGHSPSRRRALRNNDRLAALRLRAKPSRRGGLLRRQKLRRDPLDTRTGSPTRHP